MFPKHAIQEVLKESAAHGHYVPLVARSKVEEAQWIVDPAELEPARGETYALETDMSAPQWRQLRSLPAGHERGASGVVVSPPHIFLLGGASPTDAVATCLDYHFTREEWTMLPDLPAPRSHPAAMRMRMAR